MTRDYRLLLGAFFVSTTGDWIYRLALPLFVLRQTGSAAATAAIYAIEFVPYVLFSLFGGVAADRFDRRRLLVAGDLASAGLVGGMLAVVHFAPGERWLLYVAALGAASVRPFYHPAFQSFVPALVADRDLLRANAHLQTVENLLAFGGPVAGGAVVAAFGIERSLAVDCLSFAVSAAAIALIARRAVAEVARRRGWRIGFELGEAIAYLRRVRIMAWALVLVTGTNFAVFLVQANLFWYLVKAHDNGARGVGLVFGAEGAGAVVGAVLTTRLGRRLDAGRLTILGMACATAGVSFLLVSGRLAIVAAAWSVVGVGDTIIVVTWFTLRQKIVPPELLGRVIAVQRATAFAALPLGALAGAGIIGLTSNATLLVLVSAVLHALLTLVALVTPLRTAGRGTVLAEATAGDFVSPVPATPPTGGVAAGAARPPA